MWRFKSPFLMLALPRSLVLVVSYHIPIVFPIHQSLDRRVLGAQSMMNRWITGLPSNSLSWQASGVFEVRCRRGEERDRDFREGDPEPAIKWICRLQTCGALGCCIAPISTQTTPFSGAYTHQSTRLQSQAQQCCAETNEQLEKLFPSVNLEFNTKHKPLYSSWYKSPRKPCSAAMRAHHPSNTAMINVPNVTITRPNAWGAWVRRPQFPWHRLLWCSNQLLQWLNCCSMSETSCHVPRHQGWTCCATCMHCARC